MKDATILLIDDNEEVLQSTELFLNRKYRNVITLSSPGNINSVLRENRVDVILLDMNFKAGRYTGTEGLFWLKELLKQDKSLVIILITAYGNVELAVDGLKEGAFDFLLKPWDNEKLIGTINAGLKLRKSQTEAGRLKEVTHALRGSKHNQDNYVHGESQAMKDLNDLMGRVAPTDANVLILGPNGAGKEVVARQIHKLSSRSEEVFMGIDLSALSENLFESELFGHVKGAFTDAKEQTSGKIELAHKGTLFFDEIGNLPLHLQSKLLTVLQSKEMYKVGSSKPVDVDFRLLCATNKDIHKLVNEGLFRQDLLFRINTFELVIPGLDERTEDILPLAQHFLSIYKRKYDKNQLKLTSSAMEKLKNYHWPGNIRELKHLMERAVILTSGDHLTAASFEFSGKEVLSPQSINEILDLTELEKHAIKRAIQKCQGNISKASELLGVSRTTLYFKISKYGL